MTGAALSALWSHWRRNPLQLLTLIGGLALATALWSAVQAINAEARASYAAAAETLGEGLYDQLFPAVGETLPQKDYITLRRAGWLVSPVVEGRLHGIRLIGIEPLTSPGGIGPVGPRSGDRLVAFLSGEIHARAEVLAELPDLGLTPIPTPDMTPGTAMVDIGTAQRLLGLEGRIGRLIRLPDQPLGRPALAEVAPGLIRQEAGSATDIGQLTESFHLNLAAFGLLSFAVGLFITHGAVALAFAQRRPMVRTLRALGMPLTTILRLIALELATLALIAGGIGVALGLVIAAALLPDVALSLRGLYGAEVAGSLSLRPGILLSGLAIAVVGTGIAAAGAFADIARMPPFATTQPRAARAAQGRGLALVAALCLAIAGALAAGTSGLIAGFAMLGFLLIGAALLLPPALALIARLAARRVRGPVMQWFWADSRQQLPALSVALMALMLAMAANVGVATMVNSFRLTFTGFLDQRLAFDLYVTTPDPETAARFVEWTGDRVDAVLPMLRVDHSLAGQRGEVLGIRDHATYHAGWQFLDAAPDAWDRLAQGGGVIVNEQLARRAGLWLGDRLDLGADLQIIGIYGDYGNPTAQAILGEGLFRSLYPGVETLRFGLRSDRAEGLRAEITSDFGLPAAAVTDQAAIRRASLAIFERTFAVTAALNILTLAIAGFAMLMSLLTLADMRLPQLAPVWALGLTRQRLAGIEFARALALAALTGLFALPVGLALAWVLLSWINVAAFGWKLPMFLFPLDYLRLFLLALAAAALAAALPARRLARISPHRLLKVFADER